MSKGGGSQLQAKHDIRQAASAQPPLPAGSPLSSGSSPWAGRWHGKGRDVLGGSTEDNEKV